MLQISYPGVYIEEIPSGVRTITGVATSNTAFLGRAVWGPVNEPITTNSFGDFEREFGGLGVNYPMSYAIRDFYLNGGSQAIVVRLHKDPPAPDDGTAPDSQTKITVDGLKLVARTPGSWGNKLTVAIDVDVPNEMRTRLGLSDTDALFNLTVSFNNEIERFLNLTVTDNARRIDRVLKAQSKFVEWDGKWPGTTPPMTDTASASTAFKALNDLLSSSPPAPSEDIKTKRAEYENSKLKLVDPVTKAKQALAVALGADPPAGTDVDTVRAELASAEAALTGTDGVSLDQVAYEGSRDEKTGLYSLEKADLFNLLCIPPDDRNGDTPSDVFQRAMAYCKERRAFLIVDSPSAWFVNKDTAAAAAVKGLPSLGLTGEAARNAALYFPRVLQSDPLREGQIDTFSPCGIIAGIMARTDATRGVWKAPAGLDASIIGIQGLNASLNDLENGMLNPLGINCMRVFPVNGRVVWGARTLRGADQLADEYKYVPVRRTTLFIEESLYRGTQWVVFEPNDEPLWAQIRLNIGAFMQSLFRKGAFQGRTPREAYFVKCDKETTTQNDINSGIVNIVVGFAPLKPAEFVIIKLQQIAGDIQT